MPTLSCSFQFITTIIRKLFFILAIAFVQLSFGQEKLNPKKQVKFDELFFEAERFKAIEDFEQATSQFEACLKLDPKNPVVNYELAGLYLLNSELEIANEASLIAVKADTINFWYRLRYIDVLNAQGKRKEIIAQQQILVRQQPNRLDFKLQLAESYMLDLQYQNCINMLTEAERIEGVTADKSTQKKDLYLTLNNYEGARSELEKLADAHPSNVDYLGMLAQFYNQYGPKEKVEPLYLRMLNIAPNDPRAHLNLAVYYRDMGMDDTSAYHLKKALASPNMGIDPKVRVIMSFYENGQKDSAMVALSYELLDSTKKAHPKDPKIYAIFSDFLVRDGKLKEGQTMLKKSVDMGATQKQVIEQLILLDLELLDFESLKEDAMLAMELYPNQPFGYLMTGSANIALENYEEAIDALETGLIYVINNNQLKEQFYIYLADAYYQQKDYLNSDLNFDQALILNPKNPSTLNNYAYYLSVRGEKLDIAEKYSAQCNALAPNNPTFLDTWAWVLYKKGELEKAEQKMVEALNLTSKPSGDLLEHMGDIVYKLNRKEEALEYWRKAQTAEGGSELLNKKIQNQKLYE